MHTPEAIEDPRGQLRHRRRVHWSFVPSTQLEITMHTNTQLIRNTKPQRVADGEVFTTKQDRKRTERERQELRAQQRATKRGD